MFKRSDPVLFISHEATRTGAPIVLLTFLRWLSANTDIRFEVLLAAGGDLRRDFEALGRVSLLPGDVFLGRLDWYGNRIKRRRLLRRLKQQRGLIVANTITNGLLVDEISEGQRRVITYVHELDNGIRAYTPQNLEAVLRQTTGFVACSDAVKQNLVKRHGVPAARIDVAHGFVPVFPEPENAPDCSQQMRDELGIPAGALVVGASGTASWTKGADLFVFLARAVGVQRPDMPVQFVWIGGAGPGSARHGELQHDIALLGLADRVHFAGAKKNPLDYFRAFDVFALMSREDSFPLVCLEAASLGKPILCFDGAGGEPEFVEDDCGFVAPYLDIEAMATQLVQLLESGNLRRKKGERAAAKVRERHAVVTGAPRLMKAIERYLG